MSVKGNKFAEKWTEETVLEMLEKMISFIEVRKAYAIVTVLSEFKLYPQWWSEMTNKFKGNKRVSEAIRRTEACIESNIIKDTMSGDARSATFSIFLLKNKFGYKDKTEEDLNLNGDLKVINLGNGVKADENQ